MKTKNPKLAQRKQEPYSAPTQPVDEVGSLTVSATGVIHLPSKLGIRISFLMVSNDGLPTGLFEIMATNSSDAQILEQSYIDGEFVDGFVHAEICDTHFISRVVGHDKVQGALLLSAEPFFRELAHSMGRRWHPWMTFR
jgi:hypothetical protein